MHNLAIALSRDGHNITGSDDEIYDPSRTRLLDNGLLPDEMGWKESRIDSSLDCVILGMHAKPDNPELAKAIQLNVPIYSFPEFIYRHSKNKHRIVVTGSHGKTTVTSMIMHVLHSANADFDYLVGAQLPGFDLMVRLSDADIIVIEGDEYLSSPIDRVPKIWHYYPQTTIITGIAWDHKNVFPTFEDYLNAFREYLKRLPRQSTIIYYQDDPILVELIEEADTSHTCIGYSGFDFEIQDNANWLVYQKKRWQTIVFGAHNMQNAEAAMLATRYLGLSEPQFFQSLGTFAGAAKRLQLIQQSESLTIFRDFAHAPSKVKATVEAVSVRYTNSQLIACLELHTFSSLSADFLPQYAKSMNAADHALVFVDAHTIKMKGKTMLSKEQIISAFDCPGLTVVFSKEDLIRYIRQFTTNAVLLLMSSGTFSGLNVDDLI